MNLLGRNLSVGYLDKGDSWIVSRRLLTLQYADIDTIAADTPFAIGFWRIGYSEGSEMLLIYDV